MADFQIPRPFINGFTTLNDLSLDQVKKIVDVLNSIDVRVISPSSIKEALSKDKIVPNPIEFAQTVFSLGGFMHSLEFPMETIAGDLAKSYFEQSKLQGDSSPLKDRILLILNDSISLKQKAKSDILLHENQRSLKSSKIVSDIRLIFDSDLSAENRQALIIHSLKLEYTENDEECEFFVSLDKKDLLKLQTQIERALQKDSAIKKSYGSLISFLDF